MSFIREFRPFLGVTVEEEQSGKALAGVSLLPTAGCRKALNNRGIVIRPRTSGFRLFYQRNPLAADPLLGPITDRQQFTFAMISSRTDLFEQYEPDLTVATGPQLYLDNLTPSGNIQSKTTLTGGTFVKTDDAARVYPPIFEVAVDVSGGSPPTQLTVRERFPPNSLVLQTAVPASSGGQSLVKMDLSGVYPGVFTLESNEPGATATTIYIDEEIARQRVLGVVDLFWENRQDTVASGGIAYSIRFRKR